MTTTSSTGGDKLPQLPQLTQDDLYHCGFLLGVVAKVRDCAKDGCPVCQVKMANGGSLPKGAVK